MEYKKVTITLPVGMYDEALRLVERGYFSNISDLIRSGIRSEFKEISPLCELDDERLDEERIYSNKELIASVKKSQKDIAEGKGVTFKNASEMKKYLDSL